MAFMAGYSLSCFGSGLILPFTAIYIDSHLGLGPGYVAAFFALLAATSVIAGLMSGRVVDHVGVGLPGVLGSAGMGAGYLILALADSAVLVPVSAVVVGIGTGFFHPAFTPAAASLAPESLRRRVFAVRHLVMNLGLGVGAGVAALASPEGAALRLLFVLNAVSYVPLAAVLWWVGGGVQAASRSSSAGRIRGYRLLLRSRLILLLCTTQLLIALFGFAQLGSSVPLLIHDRMGETTRIVGIVMVANTVAVVVLQYPLARLFEHLTEGSTLALTGLVWVAAYGSGALAALTSGSARHILLFAFPVLFAAGEAAYSSSFYPMLTRLAPDAALGRASAVATLAFSLGNIVGPAVGVLVVSQLAAVGSWSCLSAAAALPLATAVALVVTLRRASAAASAAESPAAQILAREGSDG